MRILVTGAKGQVGTELCNRLAGKVDLLALDRGELDISDREAVSKCVSEFGPDVIINAAAHTAVDRAESEEGLSNAINRDGPLFLAQSANAIGAVILHISTDYVFDGQSDVPYLETDNTAPQGIYGITKLAGEQALASACHKHVILRTAWVFGEYGGNFVKTMLRLGAEKPELGIVADQVGAPTHAGDIADALISIAFSVTSEKQGDSPWGVYHYSGFPYVSWFEFAQCIFSEAVKQKQLEAAPVLKPLATEDYPTPAARPANSRLNCSKIKSSFGVEPSDWLSALKNLKAYK
ncbi:dTDP-4-dehydrorhamnose reductase [Enterovibrio calviensis]|uniref:dTDP-4-dehydrorhamnose reductase n=1 Tax=Enterovibrio calviensis TaxID=91359 RepID=UPI0004859CCB|nr:dTDP-4-dehydrorhamnose reductase [Enterovibrio calviensis]